MKLHAGNLLIHSGVENEQRTRAREDRILNKYRRSQLRSKTYVNERIHFEEHREKDHNNSIALENEEIIENYSTKYEYDTSKRVYIIKTSTGKQQETEELRGSHNFVLKIN